MTWTFTFRAEPASTGRDWRRPVRFEFDGRSRAHDEPTHESAGGEASQEGDYNAHHFHSPDVGSRVFANPWLQYQH